MPTHAHGFWVGMGAILLFMGGHRSLLMSVVWVWVQIRRKCWALLGIQPSRVLIKYLCQACYIDTSILKVHNDAKRMQYYRTNQGDDEAS